MEHSHHLVKASDVVNQAIKNAEGEDLGKIEDMVIEKVPGKVAYVVLSFGGFLGLGDKLFAVPWLAIHYSPDESAFILKTDKDKLKNAPGFDKDNWPDFADPTFKTSLDDFYDLGQSSANILDQS